MAKAHRFADGYANTEGAAKLDARAAGEKEKGSGREILSTEADIK